MKHVIFTDSSSMSFEKYLPDCVFTQHLHIGKTEKNCNSKALFFMNAIRANTCIYSWFLIIFGIRRLVKIMGFIAVCKQAVFVSNIDSSCASLTQSILRSVMPSVCAEKWPGGGLTNFKNVILYLSLHTDLAFSKKNSRRYFRNLRGLLVDRHTSFPHLAVGLNDSFLGIREGHRVGIPTFGAIASDSNWVIADENIGINTHSISPQKVLLYLFRNVYTSGEFNALFYYDYFYFVSDVVEEKDYFNFVSKDPGKGKYSNIRNMSYVWQKTATEQLEILQENQIRSLNSEEFTQKSHPRYSFTETIDNPAGTVNVNKYIFPQVEDEKKRRKDVENSFRQFHIFSEKYNPQLQSFGETFEETREFAAKWREKKNKRRLLKSNIFSWVFTYIMPGIRKILQPLLARLEKKVIQQKWDSSRSLSVKANVKLTLKDLYQYISGISLNAIYTTIHNILHDEYNFQNFIFRLQIMLPAIKRVVQFLWNKLSFHILFGSGEFLLMHTNLNLPIFLGMLLMGAIAGFTLIYKKLVGIATRPEGPGQTLARIGFNAISAGILLEKYTQLTDSQDLQYNVRAVMRQMIDSNDTSLTFEQLLARLSNKQKVFLNKYLDKTISAGILLEKYTQLTDSQDLQDDVRAVMRQMIDSNDTSLTFEQLLAHLSNKQKVFLSIYLDKIKSPLRKRFNTLDFDVQNLVMIHMRNVRGLENVDLSFHAILETYSDAEIRSFGETLEQIIVRIQNSRMLHDEETKKLKSDSTVPAAYWANHSDIGNIYDRMAVISPDHQPKLLQIIKEHVKGTVVTRGELDFQLRSADKDTLMRIKEDIDRKYSNKELL